MSKKDKGKGDSVFSWNDQSPNIKMTTWETGKKLNIKIYEKKWKAVKSFVACGRVKKSVQSRYARKLRYSLDMWTSGDSNEEESIEKSQIKRGLLLAKFKKTVTKVMLLRSVFIHVLKYAVEKGGHEKITSDPRLRLKGHRAHFHAEGETDVLFDPERFKMDYQGYFPKWAKEIALKAPGDRTEDEIDSLGKILRQLKEFRRYTPEIQRLLCRVVRYDRFGRHRVIIRKGHVARRFYIIYSGTVAFTLSEDDCEVFSRPTPYYNLGKGDAFGELALIRDVLRSATIVCLTTTEFLYIEKEDFIDMGIVDILRNEMNNRVEFLKEFELFSTWPHHVLQKVAEESRSLEFRNDVVITSDILQTDMLYVVIKGRCQVLRLLDLTQSKKWLKLRRNQKKICNMEFPETSSTPYSRQGAYSRLSAISNLNGSQNERKIPRTLSQPHPLRKRSTSVHIQPRLVKSAHCTTIQRWENVGPKETGKESGKESKRTSYSRNSTCRSTMSKADSEQSASNVRFPPVNCAEQSKVGVGVYLCLDVIEKGQSVGLHGVLRTDEDKLPNSNTDKRRLSLVSKGCFLITIPTETVKKHADCLTMKKIVRRVKIYPSDDALVDCYLERTKWNAFKEVLMGRMIKDIEKRRYERKPGSMIPGTAPVKQEQSYVVSRPETRQTIYGRPQSKISQAETVHEKAEHVRSRRLCSSALTPRPKSNFEGGHYPFKPNSTIYAQGSHRNLVLLNGRIRNNAIQEEVEDQLLNRFMEIY